MPPPAKSSPIRKIWIPKRKAITEKENADLPLVFSDPILADSSPSSSTSIPQATVKPSVAEAEEAETLAEPMANFPVNPLAFIPDGMTIDHGPADRKVRTMMVVPPLPPLHHDRVVIVETNRFIPIQLRESMRQAVKGLLDEAGHDSFDWDDHPFGLGVFKLIDSLAADTVIGLTFEVDEITTVTFVRHDQAKNRRLAAFGRETWILFLGFPLDYQTTFYVNRAVEDFGLLSVWHHPRGNLKYVLAKVWLVHPKFVPRSIVVTQLGGARNSWTVPVYMLRSADWNAHLHDVPPPPEDPEPEDGNPHPQYGVDLTAEQIYQNQLANWLQLNQAHNAQLNNHGHGHQNIQNIPLQHAEVHAPVQNMNIQEQHFEEPAAELMLMDPPLVNFQAILGEQAVALHVGFPPPASNLVDSPM